MFSGYQSHHNPLYNKLVELSRNIFFYKEVLLKDNFETRINLIFVHLSMLIIILKKRNEHFPQKIFDNIFLNIEYHVRELGYGDVTVNKKMKILNRIFYDILLKINKTKSEDFKTNKEILKTYFGLTNENSSILIDNLSTYFDLFYNFCFELRANNMLQGQINFNHINKNGSTKT
jgi:cytochrome b pre-mRNA-processing protein 3